MRFYRGFDKGVAMGFEGLYDDQSRQSTHELKSDPWTWG